MKFTYNDTTYETDDALSGRDFTGWEFVSRPEFDFEGKVIYATVFAQEVPDQPIFGDVKLAGTIFIRCNLVNVLVPPAAICIDCTQTRVATQNDGRPWEIDAGGKPVRVTSEKYWKMRGISVDPALIPDQKLVVPSDKMLEEHLAVVLKEDA